jgi:hypothetical protein
MLERLFIGIILFFVIWGVGAILLSAIGQVGKDE